MLEISDQKISVEICYTNYRDETTIRKIVPRKIYFGSSDWHPDQQWLLEATDLEKNQIRNFALKDIRAWISK